MFSRRAWFSQPEVNVIIMIMKMWEKKTGFCAICSSLTHWNSETKKTFDNFLLYEASGIRDITQVNATNLLEITQTKQMTACPLPIICFEQTIWKLLLTHELPHDVWAIAFPLNSLTGYETRYQCCSLYDIFVYQNSIVS